MTDPNPDLSGCMVGDFHLVRKLGEGTFGDVYLGYQKELKREVAVKVMHKRHLTEKAKERFKCEAQLASLLDHKHAAQVYACGSTDDGRPWMAMELVRGVTLQEWFKTRGPMTLEQLVPFVERVADVLDTGYKRGIIHRDLKPGNIMVTEGGEAPSPGEDPSPGQAPSPKVLDYGIAKVNHEVAFPEEHARDAADRVETTPLPATPRRVQRARRDRDAFAPPDEREPTLDGVVFGTAPYMSPEQSSNSAAVGRATDIYALGVICYEGLTGRRPFNAKTLAEYHQLHLHAAVPPLGGHFSPALDRIFQRALAKAPEDRYRTAKELASALRAELRASPPELLRSSAQRWDDQGRASSLLLGGNVLAGVERWMCGAPAGALSDLECAFIVASQRKARRVRRIGQALVALAVVSALGGFQYRAATLTQQAILQTQLAQDQNRLAQEQTRAAQQVAQAIARQSELEQGRQALLQGNFMEAQLHLTEAYRLGDRSQDTLFMLERAMQSSLAEEARFASTSGQMWSALFSPNSRQIVTTDDRSAQLWDAATNQLLFTLPHDDIVYHAVYNRDGTRVATAGGDATVKIWDAASGVLVRELTHGDRKLARYFIVRFSPDGRLVAAIDTTGVVAHVWDTSTGAVLAELRNDGSMYPSLLFSADGRWLATSGGDDVRVFDTTTWTQTLTIAGPRIRTMSFDPTGPRLVTGTAGGDAAIWAIPSRVRVQHLREFGEPVDQVAVSPNGELVVTATRDGAEQVWNARSGALQSQGNYLRDKIKSIEFDRTSTLVLAAGANGKVVVADTERGTSVAVLEGPGAAVLVAHFDLTSRRVVGASLDGTARVWDATPPYRRWSSPPISDDCGFMGGLEPDQRYVIVGCLDHATRVWDTAHDRLLAELPGVTQVAGDFTSAFPAVSADGDRAAIARGNAVEIYAPGGQLVRTTTHRAAVNAVAFAPKGHCLVSGAIDGSLLVTCDGRVPLVLPPADRGIDAAAILADGRVVAAAGEQLRIYAPGGDLLLATLAVPARVALLRPSPDGRRLITVPIHRRGAAQPMLWDIERYRLVAPLKGHVGRVFSARFVAGGEILTAGIDRTARLWDGVTGQLRQTFRGRSSFFADATLSPDGAMVVAGVADGSLEFWDASSARPLWTLPAHRSPLIGVHFEGDDIVTRGFAGDVSRWTLPKPGRVIDECNNREACAIVPR